MSDIILHHYPQSPVAEKVRVALGLKRLHWRSVEQNRMPDRPELFAMTGGYRRIPVMQIGADVYCDSQCILRELECRRPTPTFFPNGGAGLPFALSRWTDGPLFDLAFRLVFVTALAQMPPEFVADRSRLYLGPDTNLAKEAADLPHTRAQMRAQLGWIESRLSGGRSYVLGDAPGMPDVLVWHVIWLLRNRYPGAESLFAEFPAIAAWEQRMKDIGHGTSVPMSPAQALQLARSSEPTAMPWIDPRDVQGLSIGMPVSVTPIGVGGDPSVTGRVLCAERDTIVLSRDHELCGRMAVHFPRVGYRITPA